MGAVHALKNSENHLKKTKGNFIYKLSNTIKIKFINL
jgi:hypothetical protein